MNSLISRVTHKVLYVFIYFLRMDLLSDKLSTIAHTIRVKRLSGKLNNVGKGFYVGKDFRVNNPQFMSIGNNFNALERFRIEAFDKYGDQSFTPKIEIGDNVCFNTDIHIGCINHVYIGNNVLGASRIYITDHHHGEPVAEMLGLSPIDRPLVSKGAVIIRDNVWIGEGVAIMPGVTIGENCIIATNAVVTKDIPPNYVAAGVPAVVIKKIRG